MKKYLIIHILFAFSAISCIKEELPVPAHISGELQLGQVEMGANYHNQVFFSLTNEQISSQNEETNWDIAFGCHEQSNFLFLNSSLVSSAHNTMTTTFETVTSLSGNEIWKYDAPNGNTDSLALSKFDSGFVYIINRGQSVQQGGIQLGYKKIKVELVDNKYHIRHAELDGTLDTTLIIEKDTLKNVIAFSFNTNQTVNIFPNKSDYDLIFTAYTHVFWDFSPPLPYRVSGVLLNKNETSVFVDTLHDFYDIDHNTFQQSNFSYNLDEIGYDWKTYDFNSSTFTVRDNINYIIRSQTGQYYKLRFLDFYSDQGEKGTPIFEYQKL